MRKVSKITVHLHVHTIQCEKAHNKRSTPYPDHRGLPIYKMRPHNARAITKTRSQRLGTRDKTRQKRSKIIQQTDEGTSTKLHGQGKYQSAQRKQAPIDQREGRAMNTRRLTKFYTGRYATDTTLDECCADGTHWKTQKNWFSGVYVTPIRAPAWQRILTDTLLYWARWSEVDVYHRTNPHSRLPVEGIWPSQRNVYGIEKYATRASFCLRVNQNVTWTIKDLKPMDYKNIQVRRPFVDESSTKSPGL